MIAPIQLLAGREMTMRLTCWLLIVPIFLIGYGAAAQTPQTAPPPLAPLPPPAPTGGYVFTYFNNNGEDGLHLATSPDGYHWSAAGNGKSFLTPLVGESKLMRDPCVLLGPDGVHRMVWTDSWSGGTIGYARSKDLIHWFDQKAIPVMKDEPTTLNSWAPEVHYDPKNQQYLIFWSSTIPGRFSNTEQTGDKAAGDAHYNHRIYSTTTKDFETFTATKLFYDPGFDVIDATVIPVGSRFHLIVKDETLLPAAKKNLRIASSDDINGPYTNLSEPFTRQWVEGPTAIQIGADVIVYYDCYKDKHYGAVRSKDMKTWEDVTSQMVFPPGLRHGTVIAVPLDVITNLATANPGQ
jgi:hypothetical protein